METPSSTRDRLIETARELFRSQGYNATGLKQVLAKAEVNAGSLYYFFKSKEDLLLAVLDRYVELLRPAVLDPAFEQTADPIERVFAVLGVYREYLSKTGCTLGCPIGNLALEVDARLVVRERIALNFNNWCRGIRECLDAAGDRVPPDLDRQALSEFVLTVMEGGVMQARAHRSLEPFDRSVAMLRDYFNRLLAAGPPERSDADRAPPPPG